MKNIVNNIENIRDAVNGAIFGRRCSTVETNYIYETDKYVKAKVYDVPFGTMMTDMMESMKNIVNEHTKNNQNKGTNRINVNYETDVVRNIFNIGK